MEDRILDEIKNDSDVERSAHELLKLEELQDHPGWQYLAARFSSFRKGAIESIARRLMRGEEIDPKQIAFERGYAAAIEDFGKFPERLQKELERAAERAWERVQEELTTTPGGR